MGPSERDGRVPPELLYDILAHVLREYLHRYMLDEEKPGWAAVTTLCLVSHSFQDTTNKIMCHAFEVGPSETGQKHPGKALNDVREYAAFLRTERPFSAEISLANIHPFPYASGLAYTGSYLALMDGRRHIWRAMDTYLYVIDLGPHVGFDGFMAAAIKTQGLYTHTFEAKIPMIIPGDFGNDIGRLLAEEYWAVVTYVLALRLSKASGLRNVVPMRFVARAVPLVKHGREEEMLQSLPGLLTEISNLACKSRNNKYIEMYCIPEDRIDEIIARVFKACKWMIPTLKALATGLRHQESEDPGVVGMARTILEKWGGDWES